MTDLSPAAFAVWDAAWDCPIGDCSIKQGRRRQIAAALRAAADQFNSVEAMPGAPFCRNKLLAIANELEATND